MITDSENIFINELLNISGHEDDLKGVIALRIGYESTLSDFNNFMCNVNKVCKILNVNIDDMILLNCHDSNDNNTMVKYVDFSKYVNIHCNH